MPSPITRITQTSALSHEELRNVLDSLLNDVANIRETLDATVSLVNSIQAAIVGDYVTIEGQVDAPLELGTGESLT